MTIEHLVVALIVALSAAYALVRFVRALRRAGGAAADPSAPPCASSGCAGCAVGRDDGGCGAIPSGQGGHDSPTNVD